ncbi:MAG: redoxin domain-containing protein, partial [Halobacteria archaeon]|nr:redoxin domain-containing protein [Halobacteria archaeon]
MFKRFFSIPFIILALYACGSNANLRVGEPAPDFEGVDTSGNVQRLADYRGKIVVLEWTNHDCPYVRKHYNAGNMQAQQREAAAQDVVWLSVISSAPGKQGHVSPAQADELTTSRDAKPQAVILDTEGRIGRAYNAKTTPHMYIIDAAGKLVYMGGIDSITTANPDDIPR